MEEPPAYFEGNKSPQRSKWKIILFLIFLAMSVSSITISCLSFELPYSVILLVSGGIHLIRASSFLGYFISPKRIFMILIALAGIGDVIIQLITYIFIRTYPIGNSLVENYLIYYILAINTICLLIFNIKSISYL